MGLVGKKRSRTLALRRLFWFPQIADDWSTRFLVGSLILLYLAAIPFFSRKAVTIPYEFVGLHAKAAAALLFGILFLQVVYISRKDQLSRSWWLFSSAVTATIVTACCAIALLIAGNAGLSPPAGLPITPAFVVSESLIAAIAFLALVKAYFGDPVTDLRRLSILLRDMENQLDKVGSLAPDTPVYATEEISSLVANASETASLVESLMKEYDLSGLEEAKAQFQYVSEEAKRWPPDVWSKESSTVSSLKDAIANIWQSERWG